MANNIITQSPLAATGVRPGQWFLTSSEDYATLIAPGYLNSVSNAGLEFQPNDIVYAQYDDGVNFAMFIVSEVNDVFSLSVYSPNDNSFVFTQVQFVAKGGSDLNSGLSVGYPKLTIGAAITALGLTTLNTGLVWVMDDGEYDENLVLPFNIQLYAPNASLICAAGDLLTVNDTGGPTLAIVTARNIYSQSGFVINLLGAQSSMYINAQSARGDVYAEGILDEKFVTQVANDIEIGASGILTAQVENSSIGLTINSGATVAGSFRDVSNPGESNNVIYGDQTMIDHLIYQTDPITETAGRIVAAADSNTRIVYNNAANGNFELPATADVAIPLGTYIEFTQLGLGAALFIAGAGVTIVSSLGATVETNGAGATAKAWKYTDTIWVISGDLAVTP